MSTVKPAPIVITSGEPAGIGPDIVLMQAAQGFDKPTAVIGNLALFAERAKQLGLGITIRAVSEDDLAQLKVEANTLAVLDIPLQAEVVPGVLNKANGAYVITMLDKAIKLALSNKASAIVTGPVHKGIINDSGLAFTGHTEYLRDNSRTEEVVMMLATEGLRVALVTTHLPLKDVSAAITGDKIKRVSRILHRSLINQFGCEKPNILVTGLNPHAGEDGHLGMEEIDTIIPALQQLANEGIETQGPLPADTLFQPHYLEKADAVLAMYHDQGLPVLKYKGFGNAVNITLGLPFIRTSVDHGTALDLAGTGKANPGSLQVALNYANQMAAQQQRTL
ncbi:4-hydroxythreonine-4-phosphate dehydrogenase PdxA [Reinekea marinisedimentorum]|uniref:4-hydroxythreonine-4-phosphate dehydrogenase n=1 Tax=Reinekea marinisedimentorum TaxID=230495 RepID=A0A4R3HY23_9GAMM|nr:4-hydroxythreonine-4-phosphate dehydrogenase PdxA [Reinekea marinisedimentorum]TCS37181.1 4-hydroxythreonine-4-phosphate dehydrogenase [Reinekea marinisedimentorum]